MGNGLFTAAEFDAFCKSGSMPGTARFTGSCGLAHELEKEGRAQEMASRTLGSIERFYRTDGGDGSGFSTIG